MIHIIVAGPDPEGIGDAFASDGAEISRVEAPITAAALERTGIDEADIFVLTDPDEATSIPIAREGRPDLRIVVYSPSGVSDFASHQADLVISPEAMDQEVIVEELLERAEE